MKNKPLSDSAIGGIVLGVAAVGFGIYYFATRSSSPTPTSSGGTTKTGGDGTQGQAGGGTPQLGGGGPTTPASPWKEVTARPPMLRNGYAYRVSFPADPSAYNYFENLSLAAGDYTGRALPPDWPMEDKTIDSKYRFEFSYSLPDGYMLVTPAGLRVWEMPQLIVLHNPFGPGGLHLVPGGPKAVKT